MIDDELFLRGHIETRIGARPIDDFDIVIPEHFFESVLGLTGEVIDSNGSDYTVNSLDENDNFEITFEVDPVDFETEDKIYELEYLVVICKGTIVPIGDKDVLDITDYDVITVLWA